MVEKIRKGISPRAVRWLVFSLFFLILIIDRAITLFYFGFVSTDVDQLVMWNGAVDYSKGIFHEPFFYGQPYNYMLESLLAVPLLFVNVPVYKALPVATSFISILPFIALALIFLKKQKYFWVYFCLAVPILLPLQYNFLTTIPRGFVQAHFFTPLLFIPLFNPERNKSITLLFIAAAICFIVNQSSILIVFPVLVYVWTYHIKSTSFYLKALWLIPFFLIDFLFKYFYKIYPERVLHNIGGIRLDGQTFIDSLNNPNLFENLLPFTRSGGLFYPLIFVILAIAAYRKAMKRELLFILSIIFVILVSFAIPKVQGAYPIENAGIFFSASRFYLLLPLLAIISSYLVLKSHKFRAFSTYSLLVICSISIFSKNISIQDTVNETIENTSFPVAKTQALIARTNKLKVLSSEHDIDLIVHKMSPSWSWDNLYDSYALYPLTHSDAHQNKEVISVNLSGDRRSWLYEKSEFCKRILLVGFSIDDAQLESFEYEIIGNDHILIKNNKLSTKSLFERLGFEFGNS